MIVGKLEPTCLTSQLIPCVQTLELRRRARVAGPKQILAHDEELPRTSDNIGVSTKAGWGEGCLENEVVDLESLIQDGSRGILEARDPRHKNKVPNPRDKMSYSALGLAPKLVSGAVRISIFCPAEGESSRSRPTHSNVQHNDTSTSPHDFRFLSTVSSERRCWAIISTKRKLVLTVEAAGRKRLREAT